MKIVIGVPTVGTIRIETAVSLMQLFITYKDIEFKPYVTGNSLVYDARNQILNYTMKEDADYLLFVDSDIIFPYTALGNLLNQNKGIITGVYWSRSENVREPIIYSRLKPMSIFNHKPERTAYMGQINGIFEVKGCGMGFCLIRKDIIHKITSKCVSPFEPFKGLGEDLSFCYRLNTTFSPASRLTV